MKFKTEFKNLALKYAPSPIVSVGDIVETQWADWKNIHKVMISEIGIELVSLETRCRRQNESAKQWLSRVDLIGVDLYYYAKRLKKDGTPKDIDGSIVLNHFKTLGGKKWEKKNKDFNHCGLSWRIK